MITSIKQFIAKQKAKLSEKNLKDFNGISLFAFYIMAGYSVVSLLSTFRLLMFDFDILIDYSIFEVFRRDLEYLITAFILYLIKE